MEHRLIEGGFQYLPFARSRIQALRAAGRDYATERFILEDATVAVRIVGDMEYIHIVGGGCTLRMDSGVVDVGVVNRNNPDHLKPGYLHESSVVAAYNAAFLPTTPVSDWKLNPSPLSDGQLSGEVKKSGKFKGRVPYDHLTARSFTPRSVTNPNPPPANITDPGDQNLAAKKQAIAYCPASMFTGRTRLYVQSMYGQYLYEDDKFDSVGNNTAKAYPAPEFNQGGTPSISVQAYQKADDDTVYPRVEIIVSTGIYLDPSTGKHWLMTVYYGYMTVYPLISSPCGEALRKYLITTEQTPPLKDPLDEVDRNHLEAYILSCSLPWVKNKVDVALNSDVVPYSFGYGWHWNWSGTKADIVNHTYEPNGPSFIKMRATHSRLSMTLTKPDADTDVWSGSISTVEGPTDWTLHYPVWCLAVPRWMDMRAMPDDGPPIYYLYKPTPDPEVTALFACNAPIYVFYAKDVLQVCRVIVTYTPEKKGPRYSWTAGMAYGPVAGSDSETFPGALRSTLGMLGGFIDTKGNVGAYLSLKITCGDQLVENLDYGRHQTLSGYESIDNKVSWGMTVPWSGGGGPSWAAYQYRTGYPPHEITIVSSVQPEVHGHDVSAEWESYSYIEDWTSSAAIVIPFYDAEAVYIRGDTENIKSRTNRVTRYIASTSWKISERPFNILGDTQSGGQIYTFFDASPSFDTDWRHSPSEESLPDDIVTTTTETEWLSCRAGRFTCHFGFEFSLFFGPGDIVGATFDTRISCDFDNPVIFGKCPVVGATGQAATVMRAGLVGWT